MLIVMMLIGQTAYSRDWQKARINAETPARKKVGKWYKDLRIGACEFTTTMLLGEPVKSETSITEEGTVKINKYLAVEKCNELYGAWFLMRIDLHFKGDKLVKISIKDI